MRRLIIFLIRTRLKIKLYQPFKFTNQKTDAIYYFTPNEIIKELYGIPMLSGVSVNWLLDEHCEITKEVGNENT